MDGQTATGPANAASETSEEEGTMKFYNYQFPCILIRLIQIHRLIDTLTHDSYSL